LKAYIGSIKIISLKIPLSPKDATGFYEYVLLTFDVKAFKK